MGITLPGTIRLASQELEKSRGNWLNICTPRIPKRWTDPPEDRTSYVHTVCGIAEPQLVW